MNEPNQLLSRIEAAKALGISVKYLTSLVNRGQIAVVKLGKRRLFNPESVRQFVASRESLAGAS